MRADIRKFQVIVRRYYCVHGRHTLPFRHTQDPYRILVSEVMLQQTQVSRVVPKYQVFIKRFPNFQKLAVVSTRDVLAAWQGLGYSRRALYLKRLAERVVGEYGGKLPADEKILRTFPGIGPNTAGSILAFAFDHRIVFIETNIRRVFIHHFFRDQKNVPDDELRPLIEKTLPKKGVREWYWALMDYGAYLAETLPKNPNRKSRHYVKQSKFDGSERQLRGRVLKLFVAEPKMSKATLLKRLDDARTSKVLAALVGDGFLVHRGNTYCLAD